MAMFGGFFALKDAGGQAADLCPDLMTGDFQVNRARMVRGFGMQLLAETVTSRVRASRDLTPAIEVANPPPPRASSVPRAAKSLLLQQ